ncbi:MAG: hypothetical protein PVJ57_00225 [Phycisphaerae bacterium]|jgi:hypothetical protein
MSSNTVVIELLQILTQPCEYVTLGVEEQTCPRLSDRLPAGS